jgi:hypothetical protein
MRPEDLKRYSATDEMFKNDLGVGVVTIYKLKNGMSYLIMGEYHNKGALSPTVGARINKEQSIHQVIKNAFERKRLGQMSFDDDEIDEDNIYYSINTKQGFARITLIQNIKIDLSEEEFQEKYIIPMHQEAQYQRSVSEFFWKLDETVNLDKKESRFKFKSIEERIQAASKAIDSMKLAHFPVGNEIIEKLIRLQGAEYMWDEKIAPLEFYGKNGGRKYSELTGFYLISLQDILQQFKEPKIKLGKTDEDKSTVYIEHSSLPKEEKWKKFFIFEDEIKTVSEIIHQLTSEKSKSLTTFKTDFISKPVEDLVSPWKVEKINCNQLKVLSMPLELANNV